MGIVVHFTVITVCTTQARFGHSSKLSDSVGFVGSNFQKPLLCKSPNFGIRIKSKFPSLSTLMATHLQVSEGVPSDELGSSSSLVIGEDDLLVVGPGVLGRLVAEKWREVLFHIYFS